MENVIAYIFGKIVFEKSDDLSALYCRGRVGYT